MHRIENKYYLTNARLTLLGEKLENLLNDKGGRTLLYLASGKTVKSDYHKLDYDNVILVDKCFRYTLNKVDKKVITVGLDAIAAIKLLYFAKIKIDAVIILNEGLSEGGSSGYTLQGDNFMGYLMRICSDSIIHISRPSYYWQNNPGDYLQKMDYYHLVQNWMNLPYEKIVEINKEHPQYIDPKIFVANNDHASDAVVTLLSKRSYKRHSFIYKGLSVNIKHKSIWEDIDDLDLAFVRYDNDCQRKTIELLEKKALPIYYIKRVRNHLNFQFEVDETNYKRYDTDDIIYKSEEVIAKKIGVVPNGADYIKMLEKISESPFIKEITFYHLNKGDYSQLYNYCT